MTLRFPNAFILEPLWDPCLSNTSQIWGRKKSFGNKTEARFHCHGPCRRTLEILHPPSKVGLKSTACLLSVPQGVQVLGCDSGGHREAGCSGHKGWRLTEALEDGSSYGFGVRTNCLCLPLLVLISTLVRTASLGLGSLSCPSRGFRCLSYSVLTSCYKKMKGYQIEHPPFLFYTLFNGSEQFVLLILILCPDIWGEIWPLTIHSSIPRSRFLNLEDMGVAC